MFIYQKKQTYCSLVSTSEKKIKAKSLVGRKDSWNATDVLSFRESGEYGECDAKVADIRLGT